MEDGETTKTKLLGTFGDFACASMYVNKMIHAGDGGFVIAKNPEHGIRLSSLVNHGFTPSYHFVHFEPALNAKINGVGAAFACGAIDEIQIVMGHRTKVAQLYRQELAELPVLLMPTCGPLDTPWVFGLKCDSKKQRTELRAFLAEKGIETRDFFFAIHLQPAYYKKFSANQLRLQRSEILGSTGFYLPTHSNLTEADIIYISSCVRQFYNPSSISTCSPRQKVDATSLQIERGSFRVEVRAFNSSGSLIKKEFRDHIYIQAVKLGLAVDEILLHERWDEMLQTIQNIKSCIREAGNWDSLMKDKIQKHFQPYLDYFESQLGFEQSSSKAWLKEDILLRSDFEEKVPQMLQKIPTTSDSETLKLLVHIIRQKRPENIWEIGCWLGHSTFLMSAIGHQLEIKQKIFACDAFKWQAWMKKFIHSNNEDENQLHMQSGQSFMNMFEGFTKKFSSFIRPVEWAYDIETLPTELQDQRPDLIYLDITQEAEELETIWKMIKPNLIPNKTIILFNGLSHKSIPFFSNHSEELVAIAKPNTIAKAFKYTFISTPDYNSSQIAMLPKKKLNFQSDPNWDHHHKNLFCASIGLLREQFHDAAAPVMFFPAVEEKMCNSFELFIHNPWIGIIHSVPSSPELFYTPDLQRLCSSRYSKMMMNCKGLYTLTKFQADYLRNNLPKELAIFPIQPMKYPVEEVFDFQSKVPDLWNISQVDLLFVGSFARDFNLFYDISVPSNIQKVLVAGDEVSRNASKSAPQSVIVRSRLNPPEYEDALKKSVIFLSLKYEGAANTIILECIARNIPIVCPRISSCEEYIGSKYPLLYDPKQPDMENLLTLENVTRAIDYLRAMDKLSLSPKKMIVSFKTGAVLQCIPPFETKSLDSSLDLNLLSPTKSLSQFKRFDATICICSYQRTHHLRELLHNLWNNQDFSGNYQIIIWNNNESRREIVKQICSQYIQTSNGKKSLELINSSENHFCSIRFAMPPLMSSDALLICDDDIIPGPNFISFFLAAHYKHPNDVLCVRGHEFLPHEMNLNNPRDLWTQYENIRFKSDDAPEQLIHFVHADACLIPKSALREIASVEMPDETFTLVDDYWMSFILSSKFNRKLRKLSIMGFTQSPINRTEDSDQVGLALHTRPEVLDARVRLYVHHMLQKWPKWQEDKKAILQGSSEVMQQLKMMKNSFWDNAQLGYNVSSKLSLNDMKDLQKLGVRAVRIGAVGVGEIDFELCELLIRPEERLKCLEDTVNSLGEHGISTLITLDRRLATPAIWRMIALKFGCNNNVVGYDLINEPFTKKETKMHWTEIETLCDDEGVASLIENYQTIIKFIREVDEITPIIVEPSFWGRFYGMQKVPIESLLSIESNLILSFHFYEPMMLTQRQKNKGRYVFPSEIPIFNNVEHGSLEVNEDFVMKTLKNMKKFSEEKGIRLFLGEFGICRDIPGSAKYLQTIMEACKTLKMSGYLFSFRDPNWEAMDYEKGPTFTTSSHLEQLEQNELMMEISKAFKEF